MARGHFDSDLIIPAAVCHKTWPFFPKSHYSSTASTLMCKVLLQFMVLCCFELIDSAIVVVCLITMRLRLL